MTTKQRDEFKARIRARMESGLNDEFFGDMALLYSTLNDPTLDGESMERLRSYEEPEGWARLREDAAVSR